MRMDKDNWQPIHLAPKNEILILGDAMTHLKWVGWWSPFLRGWTMLDSEGHAWDAVKPITRSTAYVPSHFQRLPEAP